MKIIKETDARSYEMKKAIEKAMRQQYLQLSSTDEGKILEGIQKFIATAQAPPISLQNTLHEAAMAIYRIFSFREITIGLKSKSDGRYRYEEIVGHSEIASRALKNLSYSFEEFFDQKDYPAFRLSKYTEVALLEDQPFLATDTDTYNRPSLLTAKRDSPDDFAEGDYIDVYMFDGEEKMIGWIELGMTRDGKMPSPRVIKWMEFFASILSILVQNNLSTEKICL